MTTRRIHVPTAQVKEVQFYIASNAETLMQNTVIVSNKETFTSEVSPYIDGVYDARMGTTDNQWICGSCGGNKSSCPGHAGVIKLAYPMTNPLFSDEIIKWLRVICHGCGEFLVPEGTKLPVGTRISEILKYVKKPAKLEFITCDYCNESHPNQIMRNPIDPIQIYAQYEGKLSSTRLMNRDILNIFNKIKDQTLQRIKWPLENHPRNFILTNLHVTPNTIRPDMRKTANSRTTNNDTTSLLRQIASINSRMPTDITDVGGPIIASIDSLDKVIHTMIRGPINGKSLVTHSNDQAPVSIGERIPGKKGRIRQNLMGKRVDIACRSVISGDSIMKIDEIGVPLEFARRIQKPVRVHEFNINELQQYFSNKENVYPGCSKIKKLSDGRVYHVGKASSNLTLEVGDIIYRDLIDGDVMTFNRAPSLLPSSLTSHIIKVKNVSNTLSFNVLACNLYSADFDGDAMNGYFPLQIMTEIETSTLMSVGQRIISIQDGMPTVGAFQDTLIGVAIFTFAGQVFDKYTSMGLFSSVPDALISKLSFANDKYTNYELFSMILPQINYVGTPKMYNESFAPYIRYEKDDIKVVINAGKLQSGILDKSAVGQDQPGSLVHIINNQYGNREALDFAFTVQQLITMYLENRGFSLGIRDMLISQRARDAVQERTATILAESERITERLNRGDIIPPIGTSTREYYEELQSQALAITDDFIDSIIGDINLYDNRLYQLVSSGSKGNTSNFLMISSAVGQQKIDGNRMEQNYGYNRTLPYFTSFDTSPKSRGFICDSYIAGLSLCDAIFSSADARFALIKNSLSTSVTGAQNRTSIKNLESMLVNNLRMSVKSNRIVQFIYGETGMDPRTLELVHLPHVKISDEEFKKSYYVDFKDIDSKFRNNQVRKMLDEEYKTLTADRELFRKILLTKEDHSGAGNQMFGNKIKVPFNINRILRDSVNEASAEGRNDVLNIPEAIQLVVELCERINYSAYNYTYRKNKKHIESRWISATTFGRIAVRAFLCIRNLLKNKINNNVLQVIANKIELNYYNSFISYGTAVGIIAAESLSEPMTQFVLDSKHRAGGKGTKTDALVRIAEILGARDTSKMKNSSMFIQVDDKYANDEAKVREIANHIEMMSVGRFIQGDIRLFCEAFRKPVHPEYVNEDKMIEDFVRESPIKPPTDLINWCIRFELNRREMILKNMRLDEIITSIYTIGNVYVVYSSEISPQLIVRVYFRSDMIKRGDFKILMDMCDAISKIVVRGVPDITWANVVKDPVPRSYIDSDGAIKEKKIWVINTSGTNMADMLQHPMVDPYKIHSDSIIEIEKMFGIEAAREKIMYELKMINSAAIDKGPSYCHYTIYADEMCSTGVVTSIEKTGLNKRENANVMLKMSTSSPIQIIEDATVRGMTDKLEGVSARLMIGQTPKIGSNYNDIVMDEVFIREHATSINARLDEL